MAGINGSMEEIGSPNGEIGSQSRSPKKHFSIEETDDLKVWTKRDEINEVTVPLELGRKYYRFALQDE